jgi:hypothetical protein
MLLVAHVDTLRTHFASEIRSGKLRCVGVLGDVFDLAHALTLARDLAEQRKMPGFLLPEKPTIATYLGNCLGNGDSDTEGKIIDSVVHALPKAELVSVVLGVSAAGTVHPYPPRMWQFFLQTPYYLMQGGLLTGNSNDEFDPQKINEEIALVVNGKSTSKARLGGRYELCVDSYSASFGVRGAIYRFYYRTAGDVHVGKSEAGGVLPAGSPILLHTIKKYDIPSLVGYLRTRGEVETPVAMRLDLKPPVYSVGEQVDPEGSSMAVLIVHLNLRGERVQTA